jgi:hypothetical protein
MWRLPLWISVLGGFWLAIGFAVADIAGVSEALPDEILVAFRPVERSSREGELIQICGFGPTGVASGIQLVVLSLLFGGLPLAVLAAVLPALQRTNRNRWSGGWDRLFLAGFVFQLSSLMITALIFVVVAWTAYEAEAPAAEILEIVPFLGFLLLTVLCGIWGVRSWRELQGAAEQTPVTISPRQRTSIL